MPAIFNVKHLALANLIFLLMLILQIGNCIYFSGASEISSWRGKLCSQRVKCINNGFGKSRSFSFSTLHEDIHNFYAKLLMGKAV